ncbi:AAA family ATPase [Haloferax sp. ATB1]|uniref:AAA family ATPase n=1 Tax=Haloferax sp. ATB1 TaxID=1508454 RepID=UPI0005B218BF|nr:AAA family ATPase [Haloferax sp. ATB1]
MQLDRIRVQNYKCIEDSGWVDLEQVTCFVGKNESGKTAFLQAIEKLNPVNSSGKFVPLEEYPRKRYTKYKTRHENDPDPVVTAVYHLTDGEQDRIESEYETGILDTPEIEVVKDYKNNYHWDFSVNDRVLVPSLIDDYDLPGPTERSFEGIETIDELESKLDESEAESEEVHSLRDRVKRIQNEGLSAEIETGTCWINNPISSTSMSTRSWMDT